MNTRLLLALAIAAVSACSHTCPTPVTPASSPAATSPVHLAGPLVGYVVRLKIRPGKEQAAEAMMRDTAQKVQDREPGAFVYLFTRPTDNPADVIVLEIYADDAARTAHKESPHMKDVLARMPDVFDLEQTRFEQYDVTTTGFAR